MGSMVTFLVFITYTTNAFTILAAYLTLVLYPLLINNTTLFSKENIIALIKDSLIYSASVTLGLALYFLLSYTVEQNFVLDSIFNRGGDYTGRVAFNLKRLFSNDKIEEYTILQS